MTPVSIQGGGIAALGCERLLRRFGFEVQTSYGTQTRVPVVLLSDLATRLIRDVLDMPGLFNDAPRITKRIVAWGSGAKPTVLDHSAAVVQELPTVTPSFEAPGAVGWTVYSTKPFPKGTEELHFGDRFADASVVVLRPNADPEACWIESLPAGWLFLISDAKGCGWLLAIGRDTDSALGESRLIAEQIQSTHKASGRFPTHPRILSPLCGADWIGCGTAAVAFDPICGDGTAHALREAILASACIEAIERGENKPAVLAHYERRITEAMEKHLLLCRDFYSTGHDGPWWDTQLSALKEGFQWCRVRLSQLPPYQYSLRGFELVR